MKIINIKRSDEAQALNKESQNNNNAKWQNGDPNFILTEANSLLAETGVAKLLTVIKLGS